MHFMQETFKIDCFKFLIFYFPHYVVGYVMYFMSNSTVIVIFSPVASHRMVLLIIYTFLINM